VNSVHQVMTWGQNYWPRAMLAVALIIGGPEIYALITNPKNTLSDYSWFELGVHKHFVPTFAWYASLIVYVLVAVVLAIHIWFRGV
jgi:hypothetical protein